MYTCYIYTVSTNMYNFIVYSFCSKLYIGNFIFSILDTVCLFL